jgi:hypothetical protein
MVQSTLDRVARQPLKAVHQRPGGIPSKVYTIKPIGWEYPKESRGKLYTRRWELQESQPYACSSRQ